MHAARPLLIVILLAGCAAPSAPSAPSGPPAAPPAPVVAPADPLAPPPGAPPWRFDAGSAEAPEFAFTFDPDTATAYFDRTNPDRSRLTIHQVAWVDGAWRPAAVAPWSGTYRDIDPFVTVDGTRLYFSSDRPTAGTTARPDFDLWYLERGEAGWGEPRRLGGEVNDERNTGFVSVARDGTMYFDGHRDGDRRLYQARPTAAGYGAPVLLELAVDAGAVASNPLIAPDGSFLLVAISAGPVGDADLAVAYRSETGGWSPPQPLVGVNSAQRDFAPALSPDGRWLFFTSERPGVVASPAEGRPPGDLYQAELAAALPPRR